MDIFIQYPEIAEIFNQLYKTRRNEILQEMVETDAQYDALRRTRTKTSMLLRSALPNGSKLLEAYTDAVFAQECYELDALYRQGFLDTMEILKKRGLL